MDESTPRPPARSRRNLLIAITGALLLLYALSPYYSIWRFGEALRAHDLDGLSARVDFNAVRGSLKQQIRDHFVGVLAKKKKDRLAQFLTAAAGDPLGQLIDMYVTPEGLAAIISDPAPIRNASSISSLPSLSDSPRRIDWSVLRGAYFTGPRDFAVEREGIKLRFRFTVSGWKLHSLDLQLPPLQKSEL
ncbi:MAG TPA: DUF2939 domain-containing protein [Chthoniobacterales bacterium]|nr:DUF2939 domain-containing protein [Chthoniobacterales bacterium]